MQIVAKIGLPTIIMNYIQGSTLRYIFQWHTGPVPIKATGLNEKQILSGVRQQSERCMGQFNSRGLNFPLGLKKYPIQGS